jgi:hypothetical protein
MNSKQITGLIGSIFVIAGCFLPIIHVPFIGGISYILPPGGEIGDGVFVAAFALLGLLAAIRQSDSLLLFATIIAAAIFAYSMSNFIDLLSSTRNESDGLAGALMSAVGPDVGAAAITVGLVLMFVCSAMRKQVKEDDDASNRQCPYCAEMIRDEAIICKHCGKEVNSAVTSSI